MIAKQRFTIDVPRQRKVVEQHKYENGSTAESVTWVMDGYKRVEVEVTVDLLRIAQAKAYQAAHAAGKKSTGLSGKVVVRLVRVLAERVEGT